jgi:benzoyl-CoA reductase/2-hydroxyglutaryl-CoA dehydratase subunit BcrC/BadD/HgdB
MRFPLKCSEEVNVIKQKQLVFPIHKKKFASGLNMVKSKHLKDNISEETRKKIADEEFREIVKIANGHKKTLRALAKH